jgi:Zn-dependent M28 family amino/carboxypeptidase
VDNGKLLAKLGALAVINGSGTTQNAVSVGGGVWDGALLPLPTANLGSEDTLLLRRLLKDGPVTVEFSFKNRIREHVKVDNVVAEIPGRELPGEFVLIGAHLDSWHPGTGAQDNGTGSSTVMGVAQAVMALGRAPRRTLRFALFGGEEEGLLGSHAYAKAHEAELKNCDAVLVSDSGGEAPRGWMTLGNASLKPALAPLEPLLAGLGADGTSDYGRVAFSSDQADFMARGVPSLVLWTGFDKYMALHHKPSDTFDKVVQRDLELGVTVVGVTAYAIADDARPFAPHLNPAQVEEQMKQIKMFDEFKDMRDRGLLF